MAPSDTRSSEARRPAFFRVLIIESLRNRIAEHRRMSAFKLRNPSVAGDGDFGRFAEN